MNRSNIILEGELYRFTNDVPKKRYLCLTHGALQEYTDQQLQRQRNTYELTAQSTVRRVPESTSFELSVKGHGSDTVRFAVDSNALGDSATNMCDIWVSELSMVIEKMASEERALESQTFTSSKPYAHGWLMKCIDKGDSGAYWQKNKYDKRFLLLRDGELRYYTVDQSSKLNKMSQGEVDNSVCKGVIKITPQTGVYRTRTRHQGPKKCPYILDIKVPEKDMIIHLQPIGATRCVCPLSILAPPTSAAIFT